MSISSQLAENYKQAAQAKDAKLVGVLRLIKSELANVAIAKRYPKEQELTDEEIITVLSTELKKRRDSIESYTAGGREDLAENERYEASVIERYLPAQLTDEEIKELVTAAITEVGATGAQDFGKVMGKVSAGTKGRADGQRVSQIVKDQLNQAVS